MPKSTMREESEYPLPAGQYMPARLDSVTEREFSGNKDGRDYNFARWNWEFTITDGPFTKYKAYGNTEDRITTREDNKVRQWAEALLGREIQVGEDFDTDAVIGLPCVITVRHDEPKPKKNGDGNFYPCPVDEVFPADSGDDQEPPF